MVKKIEDEFAGLKSPQARYTARLIASGLCDRCRRPHEDMRRSLKEGIVKWVRKRSCSACTEKRVRERLYPTTGEVGQ